MTDPTVPSAPTWPPRPPLPPLPPQQIAPGWYAGYGHATTTGPTGATSGRTGPTSDPSPVIGSGARSAPPAFAAPYAAPTLTGWAPPPSRPSAAVGAVALVLAIVAAVVAPTVGGVAGWFVGQGVGTQLGPTALAGRTLDDLRFLSPVRDTVLVAETAFWAGTVLGIWAIVQGIIAIARRRGRGAAIAAVIVAPLGFLAFVVVVWFAGVAGVVAGASAAGLSP